MNGFKDIVGQEIAVAVLGKALATEKISHAYMFSGPEGVGKTTAALAFASSLNCVGENRENQEPCGECWSCVLMAAGNHPDVEVISPDGSQTKIKQAQEMRRQAQFAPARGKWKVNIIERAESLNDDAASAILKILEEPPRYLVMILLTGNHNVILPTIRSRCQLLRFFPVAVSALVPALVGITGANEEEAAVAAAYSEGRPGRAISLISDPLFKKTRDEMMEIVERLSLGDSAGFLRLSELFRDLHTDVSVSEEDDADAEAAEDNIERPARKAISARAAAGLSLETATLWYRDLLSVKLRGKDAELINSDRRERLAAQAERYAGFSDLLSSLETLFWAKRAIEGNANIQLITDVTMLRLAQAAH